MFWHGAESHAARALPAAAKSLRKSLRNLEDPHPLQRKRPPLPAFAESHSSLRVNLDRLGVRTRRELQALQALSQVGQSELRESVP